MRNIFLAVLLLSLSACGSGKNEGVASDSVKQGNSAGSDIIGIDTMHLDTSTKSISPK